jgi:recombination protein RecA
MSVTTKKWMSKLTSDFGKVASEIAKPTDKVIPLASPSLNWAIGNGGLVEGKAICFFGAESGGKSLLMQLTLIEIQKQDPEAICVLFDAEYAFNPSWFAKLGGDLDRLLVRQTNDPVKIFDWMYGEMLEMVQEGAPIKAVAIDSVKSIKYPKDMKKVSTDLTMGGGGASYLGSALKHITPVIRENNITCILVQQVYEEMDQYKKMRNPYIVPDGRALKHFCDYMAQVDKLETKDGVVEIGKNMVGGAAQIGHKVRVKFKKNRVAAPYRVAQFTLDYDNGITDTTNEVCDLATSLGVVYHPLNPATGKENNQMWQFGDYPAIRGEANMRQWISENPKVQLEVVAACNNATDAQLERRNESVQVAEVEMDSTMVNLDDV